MQFIKNLFKPKTLVEPDTTERQMRELLRENLNTVPIDVFYIDDPITALPVEKRLAYLKHFSELSKDDLLMQRIKYLINKQAIKTLGSGRDASIDMGGAMTINGIALVKDDIGRLATMHVKETPTIEKFDKFKMFPN